MAGFTTPGLLFVGASGRGELAYAGPLLEKLWQTGRYTRYVEPCVGGYSMAQIAARAGFPVESMDTSDVTLFSSVVGAFLARTPMETLDVHVDGAPVNLDGPEKQQAARILIEQLRLRLEAKPDVHYWNELRRDLEARRPTHEQAVIDRLEILEDRLAGVTYQPAGLMEHIVEHLDDPGALIHAVPPTYRAGYEKFFETDGRLTWAEPDYAIFDPDDSWAELWQATKDAAATFVGMRECDPGTRFWPDGPVYANQQRIGQYGYYVTNRTDEVLDLMGGKRVRVARPSTLKIRPLPQPIIPRDHEITDGSAIQIIPIDAGYARYYKSLWMHGTIGQDNAEGNYAVLIDGYVAGVGAVNASPINRPNAGRLAARDTRAALLLVYATGAYHDVYRLTRLATLVGLQRPVIEPIIAVTDAGTLAMVVADRVWTLEMSRHPEAKGMRGLMKLRTRTDRDDGRYDLLYEAPIGDLTPEEARDLWLAKEANWRKARSQPPSASETTSRSAS